MDLNDGFTFLQNRFISSSFSAFDEMRTNGELTDFRFTFGNRVVAGHKIIVAASVPYLRTVFTSTAADITLDGVEPDVLEAVVDFAYSGKFQITYKNVRSVLSASKFLQLDEMHNACWEFLEKILRTNNAWEIRTLAENHQRSEMIDTVDDHICQNFEEFSQSESFLDLPYSFLKEVLSGNCIKVSTEEKVFEAIIRWIKVSPCERRELLPDLLSTIRFTYLSMKYLNERVSCEDLVRPSFPCWLLVEEAKRYHMLPADSRPLSCNFCTQSRIYETSFSHDLCSSGLYAVCKSESVISVKFFDTRGKNWINLSAFAHKFLDNSVAFNEAIYILLRETILVFNIRTLTWQLLDTVHEPSYNSGMVSHKNKLYLFGGDEDLSDSVRCFDPMLEKWLPEEKMPKWCENPGVASLGDYIYVTGGDFEGDVYRSSERYDPETKEWSQISAMLFARMSHGCASLNKRIYVYGGYSDEYINLETGEVYDGLVNQWGLISPMKEVSWRVSLTSNNGKLYALEKMPTSSNKPVHVQIYDPKRNQWEFGVPVYQKDACEIMLLSAATPKVIWNDVVASNNSEEASDDDCDDVSSFSKRTSINDNEVSDDEICTTINDEGTSSNINDDEDTPDPGNTNTALSDDEEILLFSVSSSSSDDEEILFNISSSSSDGEEILLFSVSSSSSDDEEAFNNNGNKTSNDDDGTPDPDRTNITSGDEEETINYDCKMTPSDDDEF